MYPAQGLFQVASLPRPAQHDGRWKSCLARAFVGVRYMTTGTPGWGGRGGISPGVCPEIERGVVEFPGPVAFSVRQEHSTGTGCVCGRGASGCAWGASRLDLGWGRFVRDGGPMSCLVGRSGLSFPLVGNIVFRPMRSFGSETLGSVFDPVEAGWGANRDWDGSYRLHISDRSLYIAVTLLGETEIPRKPGHGVLEKM